MCEIYNLPLGIANNSTMLIYKEYSHVYSHVCTMEPNWFYHYQSYYTLTRSRNSGYLNSLLSKKRVCRNVQALPRLKLCIILNEYETLKIFRVQKLSICYKNRGTATDDSWMRFRFLNLCLLMHIDIQKDIAQLSSPFATYSFIKCKKRKCGHIFDASINL